MEKEEIAPHVSEISRVLGNKVSEEQIEKELDTYLNLYRVSLETAKRSVVRKLGGDPNALSKGVQKKLSELSGSEQNVDILVRVMTANRKEIEQNGELRMLIYGIFADETGSMAYTAWDADRFPLERGQVLLVRNAYTKEWNGKPQLNLGTRATIESQPAESVRLPDGMDVPSYGPSTAKVAELVEGMNSVTITVKILSVETRKIESQEGAKTFFSGMLADETGRAQFSAWHDFNLKKDETVLIRGAYVRSWRGIPQLNFGERAEVSRVKSPFPADLDLSRPKPRGIAELENVGGAFDVLITGVVVDVKKGSGLIQRCPQCNRLVQNKLCRLHGKVEGQYDLRIKAVVDDGAGSITAVLNKDLTEALVGITLEQAIKEAREAMDPEVVKEKIEERLLAKPLEVRGNIISDDYGLMMIVSEARMFVPEVRAEAANLLSELEGAQ
jgi:replication factor A1